MKDLLLSLRTQYIIDIIKPYTRLELSYIAKASYIDMFYQFSINELTIDFDDLAGGGGRVDRFAHSGQED